MDRFYRLSRRKFLQSAAALTVGGTVGDVDVEATESFRARPPRPTRSGRKPLALITTVYRPLSNAFHIGGRFIHGYSKAGKYHVPDHYIHSMVVDQRPSNDLSREIAKEHRIRQCRSIADAITDGNGNLTVDGILLIAEHGNYPRNDRGQILYPRHLFLKEIVDAFQQTGETAPVFIDKHLSWSWNQATEMVQWSKKLQFPLMAGSPIPLTWREPELELPLEAPIRNGIVAGYGPIEIYGFHALEALQAMMERRKGGETGVKAISCLTGKDVWKAGDNGLWSWDLLEAALSRSETITPGDIRNNVGAWPVGNMPKTPAIAFLIEYRNGSRGTVLLLNGHIQDFCFAATLEGQQAPVSCLFRAPPAPGAKEFDALTAGIEKMLGSGKAPTPIERTLLTTGMLERAIESHHYRGATMETPELDLHYTAAKDSGFARGEISAPL